MSAGSARLGFTLMEVLVALVLATLVGAALHQFLLQHRRFYSHVEAGALNHDALRVAWAVLASDLREADPSAGDVLLFSADSLRVRSPVGFGLVCAVDVASGRVALLEARGRLTAGDSVLLHAAGGWRADRVLARDPAGPSPVCPYGGGAAAAVLELEGGAADLGPGDPVRTFRSWTYHARLAGSERWLARADGGGAELLAGPLAPGGLRFRLLDEAGAPTSDPARVARVEVLTRSQTPVGGGDGPRVSALSISVRGRNR